MIYNTYWTNNDAITQEMISKLFDGSYTFQQILDYIFETI